MYHTQVNSGRHLMFLNVPGATWTAVSASKNAALPFVPINDPIQEVAPGIYLLPMGLDDTPGPLLVSLQGVAQPVGAPPGVTYPVSAAASFMVTVNDFYAVN